jgi:hypothetical protein
MTDLLSESEILKENNTKLLKLYCSSKLIKKSLKLALMRRLIREDLTSDTKLISLSEMG